MKKGMDNEHFDIVKITEKLMTLNFTSNFLNDFCF